MKNPLSGDPINDPFYESDSMREQIDLLKQRVLQLETLTNLLVSCMDTQMNFYNAKQKQDNANRV